jgi:hypothetical protein
MAYLHEECVLGFAEVQGVADDFNARLANDVASWQLVARRIHEVADPEPEDCAVGPGLPT